MRSPRRLERSSWGGRAVLVLVGIRLGLDGINPIYYGAVKVSALLLYRPELIHLPRQALFTFPQSVGIAGGRPSSSYYFMGSQADNLFYLDPHHARPAVPLRPTPPASPHDYPTDPNRETTPDNTSESRGNQRSPGTQSSSHHCRAPTSPSSIRTGSSTFSYHAPLSPSPLQHQISTSSSSVSGLSSQPASRWQSASLPTSPGLTVSDLDPRELNPEDEDLDPIAAHYVTQYSATELRTFHCDRVRKMPLSGLDPSMLLGFLCKDENDWIDLRRRINEVRCCSLLFLSIILRPIVDGV